MTDLNLDAITAWHGVGGKTGNTQLAMQLVDEEYKEVKEAESPAHIAQEAADLIFVCVNLIFQLGYDPTLVTKYITKCNYSKFFSKENWDNHKSAIKKYCNDNNCQVFKVIDDIYCIKDANGKLKKGPFYIPVDLKQIEKYEIPSDTD
jgi:predicted HAD superfamily Cof-like phosphohydrolase